MIKKCSRCGAFKELNESNFRYLPKKESYCAYCLPCEARYKREHRRQQRIKHLVTLFLNLTVRSSEAEVDRLLHALKTSWRAKHSE